MRTNLRRTVSSAAVAVAAAAFPLALASPAHATASDCRQWMASQGYVVGGGITAACDYGATDSSLTRCMDTMKKLGVPQEDYENACKHAAE